MTFNQITCNCGCKEFSLFLLCDEYVTSLIAECNECNERMINILD